MGNKINIIAIDNRFGLDITDAQDTDFGCVQDRCEGLNAQRAESADGKGASKQRIRVDITLNSIDRQAFGLGGKLLEVH